MTSSSATPSVLTARARTACMAEQHVPDAAPLPRSFPAHAELRLSPGDRPFAVHCAVQKVLSARARDAGAAPCNGCLPRREDVLGVSMSCV